MGVSQMFARARQSSLAPPGRPAAQAHQPAPAQHRAAATRPRLAFASVPVHPPIQLANGKAPKKKRKKATTTGWFPVRRNLTSFSLTSGSRKQGPHFIPHVGKILMGERSRLRNPAFDPGKIRLRSGLLPSAGQARKLMRIYQHRSGIKISPKALKRLDTKYKKVLEQRRKAKTPAARERTTAKAIELNPMATYGHGRVPTPSEMAGKGERRTTVAPDLDKMEKMKKGKNAPEFERIDEGEGYKSKHLEKLLRDTGTVSRGEEELSEMELSSDDEY